jgi:L-fuconolactonase
MQPRHESPRLRVLIRVYSRSFAANQFFLVNTQLPPAILTISLPQATSLSVRVDAHQHFWELGRFPYPWMPPPPVESERASRAANKLRRNFLPKDLAPILERNRFEGCISVQASKDLGETRWLLELAAANDFILGVVGWVDLTDPRLGATLDELQRHPKFKGVRHPVEDEPDDRWLLREDVLAGLRELARRAIPYDLLIRPKHLPLVPWIAKLVPDLRMVIDHIAKPPISSQRLDGWMGEMAAAAVLPQVWCKLSGMITEANPQGWTSAHLKPYVKHAYGCFGPERLMFGSDWPVCLQAGTWKEVLAAFTQSLGPLEQPVRERLLGGTAQEFYRL